MLAEVEIYEAYIKGKLDKEDIKNQNSKDVPLLMEELKMKFQGVTIHKNLKCNTWYTRYRLNGKQYYISAKTQKECYDKLKKALKQQNKTTEKTKSLTLAAWYDKWLALYKLGKIKQSTLDDYKKTIKNFDTTLLNKNINLITVADVIENLNKISAERQRQKVYELYSMLFGDAKKTELLDKNIMENIDKPKHKKENGKPLTYAQQEKFEKACKNNKHGDYFLLCLYQGFRKGECLAIENSDIDYVNKTINIDKSVNEKNKFDTTKNEQSKRIVPIFEKSYKILIKYKNVKDRIFNVNPKTIYKALKEINATINEHIKIKDLRSTFITRCNEENIPEFIIQTWCGHEIGSKVTKSVYTKSNKDVDYKYINILNNSKFYSNSTQK